MDLPTEVGQNPKGPTGTSAVDASLGRFTPPHGSACSRAQDGRTLEERRGTPYTIGSGTCADPDRGKWETATSGALNRFVAL